MSPFFLMGLARESRSCGPDDRADKSARIPAVPPFRSLRPDLPACTVGISPEGHDERPGTYPSRSGHAARIFGLASRTKIVEPPSRARSEELMHHRINRDLLATAALWTGVLIPMLYFGNQFVAAIFYPGYSFLSQDASTLGSADSRRPELFNMGSVVTGVLCGFTACGFLHALRRNRVHPVVAWATSLALISFGLGALNAGLHPLPDPRHISGPLAIGGIGGFLLPFLIPATLWKLPDERWMKVLFAANFALLLALFPIFSGLIQRVLVMTGNEWPSYQEFLNHCHGLLQRIAALAVVGPIGVGSYFLAKHADGPTR